MIYIKRGLVILDNIRNNVTFANGTVRFEQALLPTKDNK